jgi:RNA polymerase sigma-70 factor (sigma-E family)
MAAEGVGSLRREQHHKAAPSELLAAEVGRLDAPTAARLLASLLCVCIVAMCWHLGSVGRIGEEASRFFTTFPLHQPVVVDVEMPSVRASREFTAFAEEQGARLLRAAEYLTNDRHSAQDLVQTTLTKVFVAWSIARRGDTYAYSRRVLINAHTDTWRRRRWREDLTDQPDDRPQVVQVDHAQWASDRDELTRALSLLTERERAVVVLRYCEDMAERDVARILGISTGTVKSTTSRALSKLRAQAETSEPKEYDHAQR